MGRKWWPIHLVLIWTSLLGLPTKGYACGPDVDTSILMDNSQDDLYISCDETDPLVRNNWPVDRPCAAISVLLTFPVQNHFPARLIRTADVVAAETTAFFGAGTAALSKWQAFQADPLTILPPPKTPRAWIQYQEAVAWMLKGEDQKAIKLFQKIAQHDPTRIRALYMLGNLSRNLAETPTERQKAVRYYRQLRADVRAGVPDPLGLALASLRQEAMTLKGIDDGTVARLCRDYVANGGRRGCVEFKGIIDRILADPSAEKLQRVAKDPVLSAMLSMYLIADRAPTPDDHRLEEAWIAAIESAGQHTVWVAPAMARIAYAQGDWAGSARWAARGDKGNPLLAGVLAQLGRRVGDDQAVISALSTIQPLSQVQGSWLTRAYLNQKQYEKAMATALRVGIWEDAAWIAERVLSVEELERAIPTMPTLDQDDPQLDSAYWMSGTQQLWELEESPENRQMLQIETQQSLSLVLARRLARLGQWEASVPHFSVTLQPLARAAADAWAQMQTTDPQAHAAATLAFFDVVLPNRFALLATETAPDRAQLDGEFESYYNITEKRLQSSEISADERSRLLKHTAETFSRFRASPLSPVALAFAPHPQDIGDLQVPIADRRYHFLWHLAELAWTAADGLPPGDPKRVQLLCRGGRLLRHRAPDQADLFFKRMVLEGRPDPVAQVADRLNWFAPVNKAGACVAVPWPLPPQWEKIHEREPQATIGMLFLAGISVLASRWRKP